MGGSNNPPARGGPDFDIPAAEVNVGSASHHQVREAAQELARYAAGDLDKHHEHLDWAQKYRLRIILFGVSLALNFLWDSCIIGMLIWSGLKNSCFHLNDSVLITLASTSTANFLALVIIIAKNLFPVDNQDAKQRRR